MIQLSKVLGDPEDSDIPAEKSSVDEVGGGGS